MGWLGQTLPVTFTKMGFVCCCTKALRIVPAWDIPQRLQQARINFTRVNYFDNTSELLQQKENKWSTRVKSMKPYFLQRQEKPTEVWFISKYLQKVQSLSQRYQLPAH